MDPCSAIVSKNRHPSLSRRPVLRRRICCGLVYSMVYSPVSQSERSPPASRLGPAFLANNQSGRIRPLSDPASMLSDRVPGQSPTLLEGAAIFLTLKEQPEGKRKPNVKVVYNHNIRILIDLLSRSTRKYGGQAPFPSPTTDTKRMNQTAIRSKERSDGSTPKWLVPSVPYPYPSPVKWRS